MKKIIVLLALLGMVALPASAMAAKTGTFEIGGYIKLHTWWDSTSTISKDMIAVGTRNNAVGPASGQPPSNNPTAQQSTRRAMQGRWQFTARNTRLNFKIKGPELWGAKTQGFLEIDFDTGGEANNTITTPVGPRLRHAIFRMSWPGGWELMMGQYWGLTQNFWPNTVQHGPLLGHGMPLQRVPQIRVSYAPGPWTFTAMACAPQDVIDNGVGAQLDGNNNFWLPGTGNLTGERATMPQLQFSIQYEKDLWGKAAFFDRPRGFVANATFCVQRSKYDGGFTNAFTWGQNNYAGNFPLIERSQTLTPWYIQGTMFIPVLPTHTKDLKGTASLQVQAYVGQGLRAFGNEIPGSDSYFLYDAQNNPGGALNGANTYRRQLMKRYGGYAQLQYYITNQWYLSYLFGFAKAYDVSFDRNPLLFNAATNPGGYEYATTVDQVRDNLEHNVTLFFRPSTNFKFGLAYVYLKTTYFQIATKGSQTDDVGENHRVQFAGWFYF